jgi:hypothetical protein
MIKGDDANSFAVTNCHVYRVTIEGFYFPGGISGPPLFLEHINTGTWPSRLGQSQELEQ